MSEKLGVKEGLVNPGVYITIRYKDMWLRTGGGGGEENSVGKGKKQLLLTRHHELYSVSPCYAASLVCIV